MEEEEEGGGCAEGGRNQLLLLMTMKMMMTALTHHGKRHNCQCQQNMQQCQQHMQLEAGQKQSLHHYHHHHHQKQQQRVPLSQACRMFLPVHVKLPVPRRARDEGRVTHLSSQLTT